VITLYYLSGPRDLSKWAVQKMPKGDMMQVEEFLPWEPSDAAPSSRVTVHHYAVRQVGRDVWIAVHEALT
jgi:hypothetical protein